MTTEQATEILARLFDSRPIATDEGERAYLINPYADDSADLDPEFRSGLHRV
jgi:hypothetical protein